MSNLIITKIPNATADAVKTAIQAQINIVNPFKVSLNNAEKKGARAMAAGREGLARMVSKIASANIQSLAREQNPQELEDKLAYDAKLEEIRQVAMNFFESIEETQLANAVDIMKLVDTYSDNLQASRKNNSALDLAMQEVDDWNQRFAGSGNTTARNTTTE